MNRSRIIDDLRQYKDDVEKGQAVTLDQSMILALLDETIIQLEVMYSNGFNDGVEQGRKEGWDSHAESIQRIWLDDGEANFYTLQEPGDWFARIQINGKYSLVEQRAWLGEVFGVEHF